MTSSPTESGDPAPSAPRRVPIPSLLSVVLISLVVAMLVVTVVVWTTGGDHTPDVREVLEEEGAARSTAEPDIAVPEDLDPGDPAPSVTFEWLDGSTPAESGDVLNSPTVLNFWSSTCAPCLSEMPAFEAVHTSTEGVNFVGIDVTDTVEAGTAMAERTGVTYRNARDPRGEILAAFGGTALPYTVLIDADGTVIAEHSGALSEADLRDLLADQGLAT